MRRSWRASKGFRWFFIYPWTGEAQRRHRTPGRRDAGPEVELAESTLLSLKWRYEDNSAFTYNKCVS